MANEPTAEIEVTPEQKLRNELGPEGGFVGKSVQELEEESVTDQLTGLNNRRGFDEGLKRMYEQAKRTGDQLQIIFIDADGFKGVNTKYGRLGGDEVLKAISEAMRGTFRSYDLLSRWGGDEFVVVALQEPFKEQIHEDSVQMRLNEKLKRVAPKNFDPNDLSVTVGAVNWDGISKLDSLQRRVHAHMEERK